ncbi:hypothetical protein [Arthrobacter cryoconiti]|uniref:Transposase n=1 Tax=Arthrobacter cryoconiti TaxID=748907 RepID=A0ABV8QZM2_9MICC|nr:hypothetical protein [Arthrobacter cryoconiti]MCC9068613.1 hypothetical protein [Arthrobacter cryoconiti]
MNKIKADGGVRRRDGDLGQATTRELIVQLALAEEERRNTASPGRIAEIAKREQDLVAALRKSELTHS